MGQPFDDRGPRRAVIAVQEVEQGLGGGEPDRGGSRVVAVVFEDLAGFPDEVADARGGDLQQVRQHVHGADLPLVEEREQKARGVVEQRPGARIPGGSPGPAAALLAVSLLGPGSLRRGERGGQLLQLCRGHAGQPRVGQPAEHRLAALGRTAGLTGGCRSAQPEARWGWRV